MTRMPHVRMLPDGRRLHLQDGPIDLVVQAFGSPSAITAAYRAAAGRLVGLLDELCRELAGLREGVRPELRRLAGPVAQTMEAAVAPFAGESFITPMAAVAGAVADAVLAAMTGAAKLERAYVNNGGDIALHCAPGHTLRIGLVDRPDRPSLMGDLVVGGRNAARGVATSGWRGRSFSLGIADSVTVLALTAAEADAAATVVANAVDLPGHPAVQRTPAAMLQPDSDLGDRLVTRAVGPLPDADIAEALGAGLACAERLLAHGLIAGAALQVQGRVRVAGARRFATTRAPERSLLHA